MILALMIAVSIFGIFSDCTSLEEFDIPESVTHIYYEAFFNCTSLMNITIPASVTYIDWDAFGYYGEVNKPEEKLEGFTISGYMDTEAQKYAEENGISFICLDEKPSEIKNGDADGDGEITIVDATAIQRHLASLPPQYFVIAAADVDKDGEVTIIDATDIQRFLAGLPTEAQGIGEPI